MKEVEKNHGRTKSVGVIVHCLERKFTRIGKRTDFHCSVRWKLNYEIKH